MSGLDLRPIPSHPGYLASSDGHIYSTRSRYHTTPPRLLTETPTHDGYLRVRVSLGVKGWTRRQAVAPLVAEAFHGPRPQGQQVRHVNGAQTDNRACNLTYGTAQDNADDRERHGHTATGLACPKAHTTDQLVREAVALYAAGVPRIEVARRFGVSPTAITHWATGRTRRGATQLTGVG